MQEAIRHPTVQSEETDALTAAALRAEAWSGESFLHPGEDAASVLAEGHARRRALDAALLEVEAGRRSPSPEWKVNYALMLGLERVLTDRPPRLASGTELRRHQIDALAGMLAELIARHEEEAENGNGNGNAVQLEERTEEEEVFEEEIVAEDEEVEAEGEARSRRARLGRRPRRCQALPLPPPDGLREDDRRRRLRRGRQDDGRPHPHAPAPAREPVHDRPDHGGLRRAPARRRPARPRAAPREPDHDSDVRVVRAPRRLALAQGVPAGHLRRGAHRARRQDELRHPAADRADLHRHDGDRAADRQAGLGRLPGLGRRPAPGRCRAPGPDRAAALPPR